MGAIRPLRPVNLICGVLSNDPDLAQRAVRLLSEHAGEVDLRGGPFDFDHYTDYYALEMGEGLRRWFVSFEKLIDPGQLPWLKGLTNQIEQRVCYDLGLPTQQRRVNLDPGYLTLAKLVLATTKDYSHRIYIGSGMYAESTLHYEQGGWVPWPWTYPDFAGGEYFDFLTQVREAYRGKLNELGSGSDRREGRA